MISSHIVSSIYKNTTGIYRCSPQMLVLTSVVIIPPLRRAHVFFSTNVLGLFVLNLRVRSGGCIIPCRYSGFTNNEENVKTLFRAVRCHHIHVIVFTVFANRLQPSLSSITKQHLVHYAQHSPAPGRWSFARPGRSRNLPSAITDGETTAIFHLTEAYSVESLRPQCHSSNFVKEFPCSSPKACRATAGSPWFPELCP